MRATQRFIDGEWVDVISEPSSDLHFVQGDLPDFQSPDGQHISGRSQWREHLKRTDTVEMGHSDVAAQKVNWDRRQSDFQKRLKGSDSVREVTSPDGPIRPIDHSRLNSEVLNRLDGRPEPDRKTLIKLTLETDRMLRRR